MNVAEHSGSRDKLAASLRRRAEIRARRGRYRLPRHNVRSWPKFYFRFPITVEKAVTLTENRPTTNPVKKC